MDYVAKLLTYGIADKENIGEILVNVSMTVTVAMRAMSSTRYPAIQVVIPIAFLLLVAAAATLAISGRMRKHVITLTFANAMVVALSLFWG
jgi:hypothetical protein